MTPNKSLLYSILAIAMMSLSGLAGTANAQTTEEDQSSSKEDNPPVYVSQFGSTSSTTGARYEVLRDKSGDPCFRIDKYTGKVWKLVYLRLSNYAKYHDCEIEPSDNDVAYDNTINYQLLVTSSGHAILMNLNTGELWEYNEKLFEYASKFKLMQEGVGILNVRKDQK